MNGIQTTKELVKLDNGFGAILAFKNYTISGWLTR